MALDDGPLVRDLELDIPMATIGWRVECLGCMMIRFCLMFGDGCWCKRQDWVMVSCAEVEYFRGWLVSYHRPTHLNHPVDGLGIFPIHYDLYLNHFTHMNELPTIEAR